MKSGLRRESSDDSDLYKSAVPMEFSSFIIVLEVYAYLVMYIQSTVHIVSCLPCFSNHHQLLAMSGFHTGFLSERENFFFKDGKPKHGFFQERAGRGIVSPKKSKWVPRVLPPPQKKKCQRVLLPPLRKTSAKLNHVATQCLTTSSTCMKSATCMPLAA